ncbi:hypothetical protein PCI56_19430 [Plesiomonas shigelloides subsp. oncorhynchi]|nr:hypothetical protein [Plesiomonas shigelloides]
MRLLLQSLRLFGGAMLKIIQTTGKASDQQHGETDCHNRQRLTGFLLLRRVRAGAERLPRDT